MAIELASECIVTLAEAAKILPPLYGKRPAISTIWRWCRKGIRGVHLEYIRVGRNIATSREALGRFVNRLAEADVARSAAKSLPPVLPDVSRVPPRPAFPGCTSTREVLARAGLLSD
jgi:hypothetical protein